MKTLLKIGFILLFGFLIGEYGFAQDYDKEVLSFAGGQNLYEVLGVKKTESFNSIQKRYSKLYKKYHPYFGKSNGDALKLKQLNEAYYILSHPVYRYVYDVLGIDSLASYGMLPPESNIIAVPLYKTYSLTSASFLKQLKKTIKFTNAQSLKNLVISLKKKKNGKFENLKIEESSGNNELDQSVINSITQMGNSKSNRIVPAYNIYGEPIDFKISIMIPESYLSNSGDYIAKSDAIRREQWLQRLKDKGRWVYNPAEDRDNVPVSPTMYPTYQNQPRF